MTRLEVHARRGQPETLATGWRPDPGARQATARPSIQTRDLIVFTLRKDEGGWKFTQQEGILFPLFDYPDLPYERILLLSPDRRGSMVAEREET